MLKILNTFSTSEIDSLIKVTVAAAAVSTLTKPNLRFRIFVLSVQS